MSEIIKIIEELEVELPESMKSGNEYYQKYSVLYTTGFSRAKTATLRVLRKYQRELDTLESRLNKLQEDIDRKNKEFEEASTREKPKSVYERFMENVDKTDTCWLWAAGKDHNGYGLFTSSLLGERSAHRCSYTLFKGPIPEGLFVCHTCDVPACVNPSHLWLGTAADNNTDKKNKGRCGYGDNVGTSNPNCRYTEDQIRQVAELRKQGLGYRAISNVTGINKTYVGELCKGKYWKHLNLFPVE